MLLKIVCDLIRMTVHDTLLALVLIVTLPRFMASNPSICAVLGASWTTTTTGVDACVFYQR